MKIVEFAVIYAEMLKKLCEEQHVVFLKSGLFSGLGLKESYGVSLLPARQPKTHRR